MAEVNRAHEVLSDAGRRAAWDAANPVAVPRPGASPPSSAGASSTPPAPPARPSRSSSAGGARSGAPGSEAAGADRRQPSLDEALAFVLQFGKHRGRTLGYVAAVEPGYVAWLARTVTNRPATLGHARTVLAHLESRGWRDTPRAPRAHPAGTRTAASATAPRSASFVGGRSGLWGDVAVRVVVAVVLLLVGWGMLQGALAGPQPGDIVCELYDPRLGDCVLERVYAGE